MSVHSRCNFLRKLTTRKRVFSMLCGQCEYHCDFYQLWIYSCQYDACIITAHYLLTAAIGYSWVFLVRTLIHSRLDYYNGLFDGLPAVQFARLQSVLRAAARLVQVVLGLPGRAPVSAVMSDSLHWLSFPQPVTFKLSHDVQVSTWSGAHVLVPVLCTCCCRHRTFTYTICRR